MIGLLGAALGLSRHAMNERLGELNKLAMTVRVDRAGHLESDYQTVGANIGVLAADGEIKKTASTGEYETIISPREYLIDASFLVVLRGDGKLIKTLANALRSPHWPLFLGRKRCIPGTCIFAGVKDELSLSEAVQMDGPDDQSLRSPESKEQVRIVTDLIDAETFGALAGEGIDSDDLNSFYEVARSYVTDRLDRLDPPIHSGRIVLDFEMPRPAPTHMRPDLRDSWFGLAGPSRPHRAYDPRAKRTARSKSGAGADGRGGRCIFCRFEPLDPRKLHAHHLTYIRRGREHVDPDSDEIKDDDFVMLCKDCHDAVSMLEYQIGFGLSRIDPRDSRWHARIHAAREARRRFRNPAHPHIGSGMRLRAGEKDQPLDLVESILPLRAGAAYSAESPGNRWLANRQHVHQRLSMAFPGADADRRLKELARGYGVTRDEGGYLFRIEHGREARIIVRSRILPDWGRAFAKAAWLVHRNIPTPRQLDLTALRAGTELAFALEANPIKRLREHGPEGKKGARVPLLDDNALEQWMARRASDSGFEIISNSLNIERRGHQMARMKTAPNRHWASVSFTGRLCITDIARFRMALMIGIGPAKAFGFGLLSIAPASASVR